MDVRELEARVRALGDLEEIRDLARRYAHCVWLGDAEGAARLFTEGGVMDTGGERLAGRAAIRESYARVFAGARFLPFVHDHVVELDGDLAAGRCHLDLRAEQAGQSLVGAGCYDDRYERVGGRWLFSERRLALRWLVPLAEGWAGRDAPAGTARLAADPPSGPRSTG